MADRNKTAMYLAIAAGVLLLVAGVTGVGMIKTIEHFVTDTLKIDNVALSWVFLILLFMASLGGILCIIGGVLIGKNKVGVGKFCITIGVGTGLIGLIIAFVLFAVNKTFDTSPGAVLALVGIILSVAARMMAKKTDMPQQDATPQPQAAAAGAYQQSMAQETPQQASQTTYQNEIEKPLNACPTCGNPMEYVAQYGRWYCRTCGRYP